MVQQALWRASLKKLIEKATLEAGALIGDIYVPDSTLKDNLNGMCKVELISWHLSCSHVR